MPPLDESTDGEEEELMEEMPQPATTPREFGKGERGASCRGMEG